MKEQPVTDKSKPFVLVKYFTFTSLIVVFFSTIILSALNNHWVRKMQYKKSEDYALLLIENMNHQVLMQFLIPAQLTFGEIKLRTKKQAELMDTVVRSALHGFNVEMVNIYASSEDLIAYSFSKELVGMTNLGGSSYQNAVKGSATSKLVQNGSLFEIFFGIPKEVKIITFAPLRVDLPNVSYLSPLVSGHTLGVVEIVQDITADYQAIVRFQAMAIATIAIVMSLLFMILIFVVKRGEGIIQKRAFERLKLEEQLARAKHFSTLGEMVASVSHEIRNPLGIISSSAELLKKKMQPSSELGGISDIIIEESGRLNNIITDFLNFARPKEPNLVPCRIHDVIQKNISFLAAQFEDKGYRIVDQISEDLPVIKADPDLMYQAFLNIFINAMQAMPNGGRIILKAKSDNGDLNIIFDDNGAGIPETVLDKLWNPFFTTKERGTGLGLGIVKNIIESHGGEVNIENRPGGGARVLIQLPQERGED